MVLVGPRIAYAMALDGLFVRGVEDVHPRYRTPHRAIVLQAVVAVLLLLVLRTFPRVLDFTTFAIVVATIADTAALYTLRRRRPAQPRPYRAWGYPLVPALYLVANAAIALALLWGRPVECAIATVVVASGLPFYWWFVAQARRPSGR
jgi:APA family basic amino acid/polyamine antiporter